MTNVQKGNNLDENVENRRVLSEEKYDFKLFKQAYKAAKEAKELESKLKKRGIIIRFLIIIFSLMFLLFTIVVLISLFQKKQEYIQMGYYPKHLDFESIQDGDVNNISSLKISISQLQAQNAIVINPKTGKVLLEKNAYEKIPVASLTKILSSIVVLEEYNLEDTVEVSLENIPESVNWSLGLEEGDRITILNLLKAMLLSSFNDAAYVVANAYPNGGYDGFVAEMNNMAITLRMKDSNFVNPSGWDQEGAYSTAFDLAILTSVARRYSAIVEIVSSPSEIVYWTSKGKLKSKKIYTTNQLLGINPYIIGFKTGITDLAGPCFIGYFLYDNDEEIVTVVINSKDRFEDTEVLEKSYRLTR
jgi:D-alanyl-D-alanine carboxypeptidase